MKIRKKNRAERESRQKTTELLISARDRQSIKLHSAQTKNNFLVFSQLCELGSVFFYSSPAHRIFLSAICAVLHVGGSGGGDDGDYLCMHLECVNCFQFESESKNTHRVSVCVC